MQRCGKKSCGKKSYWSEAAAKAARRQFSDVKATVYFCKPCRSYHLTTNGRRR